MRKSLQHLSVTVFMGSLIFASCSGDKTEQEQSTEKACFYSYNEGSSELIWTAYKTNDKVPVSGGFNEITVTSEKAEDPKAVLESISFTIETASVESNNEDRNAKISKFFFGTMETPEITGKIRSVKDDGKAIISIKMHGIELDVEGDYTLENAKFTFNSSIDVSKWNGMSGIEALNTECKDLHTGADGESKLWSEVGLSFTTTLSSDCD